MEVPRGPPNPSEAQASKFDKDTDSFSGDSEQQVNHLDSLCDLTAGVDDSGANEEGAGTRIHSSLTESTTTSSSQVSDPQTATTSGSKDHQFEGLPIALFDKAPSSPGFQPHEEAGEAPGVIEMEESASPVKPRIDDQAAAARDKAVGSKPNSPALADAKIGEIDMYFEKNYI